MGWLLNLLFEAVRELCSQFIIDMMDIASGMFTEILSCDLDLFEQLFGVVGEMYQNAVLPLAVALLLMILTWQLFKSMFGKLGTNSEEPLELVFRSGLCLFLLVYARDIVNYILEVAGTPYQWVVGTGITVDSFSGYVSAAEAAVLVLGVDAISISMLLLIMHFVVAWNYFKLLFILAERYVLLGVLSYTAPLAFATGGSKATGNILASWSKMFGGQVMIIILDAWCLKMFLAGYGNLMASTYGFTKFFAANMCLIGFCKIAGKLDSYMASLGVSVGRTMGGLSGLGALMMAGRLLSMGGHGRSGAAASGSGHMNFGNGKPIPMGGTASGGMSGMGGTMTGGAGSGIGGMDAGTMPGDYPGMGKESQSPDMGDGFGVFQTDDPALAGQNLPFGAPEDENGVTQGMDTGMQEFTPVPEEDGAMASMEAEGQIPMGDTAMESFDEEPLSAGVMTEGGELPPMEDMESGGLPPIGDMEGGELPPIEDMESGGLPSMETVASGNQVLPFGNVEEGAGEMETGGNAGISGLEHTAQAGISMPLEDGTAGSGISSFRGTQETSASGLAADSSGTGAMEHMAGMGTVTGMEAVGTEPSSRVTGQETSGTGHALPMGEGSGIVPAGTAGGGGTTESVTEKNMPGPGGGPAMSGIQRQGGVPGGLHGCYQAERDGKQYMRYDAGLYGKPKGPYQTIHENGKTYYELPKQENAPALLPETKAVLEKDGTLRLEKVYQQKELMEKPKEQPPLQERAPEPQVGKKESKKPGNQAGNRRRNQRGKTSDRK